MMLRLESLLRQLYGYDVDFVVIGGVAAIAQGSARVTFDMDVCYSRDSANLERLAAALAPLTSTLRDAPPDLPFRLDSPTLRAGLNFTLDTSLGPLDLLGEVAGLGFYEQVLAASEVMELYGMPIAVLTLEGLIAAKRAAGRPRDLEDLIELEALLELRRQSAETGANGGTS